MVDTYGRWTYEPNTPEEKKCDCDRLADAIFADGYEPQTSLENLVMLVFSHYEAYLEDRQIGSYCTGEEITDEQEYIKDVREFVRDDGGWKEYDYEC